MKGLTLTRSQNHVETEIKTILKNKTCAMQWGSSWWRFRREISPGNPIREQQCWMVPGASFHAPWFLYNVRQLKRIVLKGKNIVRIYMTSLIHGTEHKYLHEVNRLSVPSSWRSDHILSPSWTFSKKLLFSSSGVIACTSLKKYM